MPVSESQRSVEVTADDLSLPITKRELSWVRFSVKASGDPSTSFIVVRGVACVRLQLNKQRQEQSQ